MLRRISEPLALAEASLLALRPALNAPVLNVDYLPVGPARAAIVIFAEEYGGIGMAFGIRSSEGGQVAVFRNREPIDESAPLQDILEPALASAERMGFLFDEDMVQGPPGGHGRREATALWGRLMGEVAMPPSPKAAPALPAATEPILDLTETMDAGQAPPELILEQVALPEAGGTEPEIETTAAQAPPPTLPEAPAPALSKFRHPPTNSDANPTADPKPAPADVSEPSDATSHLGRVPLVRVSRGGEKLKRIPYLTRLLSSF